MKTPKEWMSTLTSADALGPNLYRNKSTVGCVDEADIAAIQKDALDKAEEALKAFLLFYLASPWDEAKRTQWWNATQTSEATTRNLCDTARYALGLLPSCFGDFTGRTPDSIPPDMRLSHEQQNALRRLGLDPYTKNPLTPHAPIA